MKLISILAFGFAIFNFANGFSFFNSITKRSIAHSAANIKFNLNMIGNVHESMTTKWMRYAKSIASVGVISFGLCGSSNQIMAAPFTTGSVYISDSSTIIQPQDAISNLKRIGESLGYIQDDINANGDIISIIKQIKFLLKNYNIRENVQFAEPLLVSSSKKQEAKEHGIAIIEDLSQ
eukprot:gene10452-14040_t